MTPPADPERYKNHRFPGEIISHGVWLYYRFPLSYRDVQELLFERGIDVTHEAIRQWCRKFGQDYANQLKRRRAQPGDKWHLDEVFLTLLVASFDNHSNLLNRCDKTEPRAVSASVAHGPENMAIPRISVFYTGAESHPFFFAHRSHLMRSPSL